MAEVVVEGKLRGSSLLPLYHYYHRHQFATTITINPGFRLPRVPRSMWGFPSKLQGCRSVRSGVPVLAKAKISDPGDAYYLRDTQGHINLLALLPLLGTNRTI